MTKDDAVNLMEYAIILARHTGATPSAYAIASTVSALGKLGREAHSWAERMCNYGEHEGASKPSRSSRGLW